MKGQGSRVSVRARARVRVRVRDRVRVREEVKWGLHMTIRTDYE